MQLVLLGGGGHGLVVAEAAGLLGMPIVGVFDDDERCELCRGSGAPRRLGALSGLDGVSIPWILCVGDLAARERLLTGLAGSTGPATVVAHPVSFVSPSARLGGGVYVGPRAVVHAQARVGPHAIVNTGAIVEHSCELGLGAHVAPGAVLGGGVSIGAYALVGLGARVLPGVRIGARCVVGAGALVREDVPEGTRVAGVPAREITRRAARRR